MFISRRRFAVAAAVVPSLFHTQRGLFAEELAVTPSATEGPFYPDHLPLDTDNDLLVINDGITPAVGEVTYLSGKILDRAGEPIRNAYVEIWQCDSGGAYLHSKTSNADKRDKNFQGFGRFVTGATGEYLFRTIKPVPYPGRTPHIHFKVKAKGQAELVTQCYVKGEKGNERDGIWRSLGEATRRDLVTVDFAPLEKSKIGELAAKFDIVLGATPADGPRRR
jgi:protocatechuate 3,4-dioxygenase, beta subunit